ncbi:hypothetical protein AVEN_246451-1 [Araneus ventricosus]|uniref:Uncharacterized protein n=1 Tax=Araneus ventricosus TaxID=182803 RepID=A0A4Y2EMY7_ARAVE|nr:hypothetical protein AVEN_246451-1 [Araneus ventricosus]
MKVSSRYQLSVKRNEAKFLFVFITFFLLVLGQLCPSGKSRLWAGGLQVRNLIPLKIRRVWGLLHAKSYVVAERPPAGVAWKLGEGVPAQVSSSDRGSKLRGPSQNSPRVASKRDVNISNPNCLRDQILTVICEFQRQYVLRISANDCEPY